MMLATGIHEGDIRLLARYVRGEKVSRLIDAGRIRTSTVTWRGQTYTRAVCLPWRIYVAVFAFRQRRDGRPFYEAWLDWDATSGHMHTQVVGNIFAVRYYTGYRASYVGHPWQDTKTS